MRNRFFLTRAGPGGQTSMLGSFWVFLGACWAPFGIFGVSSGGLRDVIWVVFGVRFRSLWIRFRGSFGIILIPIWSPFGDHFRAILELVPFWYHFGVQFEINQEKFEFGVPFWVPFWEPFWRHFGLSKWSPKWSLKLRLFFLISKCPHLGGPFVDPFGDPFGGFFVSQPQFLR